MLAWIGPTKTGTSDLENLTLAPKEDIIITYNSDMQ